MKKLFIILMLLAGCQTFDAVVLYECKAKSEIECDAEGKWYPIATQLGSSDCLKTLAELKKSDKEKMVVCRAGNPVNSKAFNGLPWM